MTRRLVAGGHRADLGDEGGRGVDRLAVDGDDDVAGLDAGLRRRACRSLTDATSAPARWAEPSLTVVSLALTPRKACSAWPVLMSWSAMDLASLTGIAKPMPMLPLWLPWPPPSEAIELLMPISSPFGVDERAAGVAGVDRGRGLDGVGDDRVARCLAVGASGLASLVLTGRLSARHDAGGHGARQAERVADGHDRVADLEDVAVAEADRREVARAPRSA